MEDESMCPSEKGVTTPQTGITCLAVAGGCGVPFLLDSCIFTMKRYNFQT